MKLKDHKLGSYIQTDEYLVFFGNRNANLTNLQSAFPNLKFIRLKQTHSDQVVETDPTTVDYTVTADAHFCRSKNIALCSISADCIPVLIYSKSNKLISAIHSGWRGVANRLVPKTIEKIKSQISANLDLEFFVGPHIQMESFEVGKDVEKLIMSSIPNLPDKVTFLARYTQSLSEEKSKIDLKAILLHQLNEFGFNDDKIHYLFRNTFNDLNYHSARRDKESSGRQISFIALI